MRPPKMGPPPPIVEFGHSNITPFNASNIIDFLLSAKRDAHAAKRFFQKALRAPGHPLLRVINVDGSPYVSQDPVCALVFCAEIKIYA